MADASFRESPSALYQQIVADFLARVATDDALQTIATDLTAAFRDGAPKPAVLAAVFTNAAMEG